MVLIRKTKLPNLFLNSTSDEIFVYWLRFVVAKSCIEKYIYICLLWKKKTNKLHEFQFTPTFIFSAIKIRISRLWLNNVAINVEVQSKLLLYTIGIGTFYCRIIKRLWIWNEFDVDMMVVWWFLVHVYHIKNSSEIIWEIMILSSLILKIADSKAIPLPTYRWAFDEFCILFVFGLQYRDFTWAERFFKINIPSSARLKLQTLLLWCFRYKRFFHTYRTFLSFIVDVIIMGNFLFSQLLHGAFTCWFYQSFWFQCFFFISDSMLF